MRLDGLEVVIPRRLLVLGICLVFFWVEEGLDEAGTPCSVMVSPMRPAFVDC